MTTGRINQVAFLRDVGRRPHDATPTDGLGSRTREGATVVISRRQEILAGRYGGELRFPRPHNFLHPRARPTNRAPMLPQSRREGHGRRCAVCPAPTEEVPDEKGHENHNDFQIRNATQEPPYFTSRQIGSARVQVHRGSRANSSTLERGACRPVRPHHHSCAIAYTGRQPHRANSMPHKLVEPRRTPKHQEESLPAPLSAGDFT